jgi:hypothetical protein
MQYTAYTGQGSAAEQTGQNDRDNRRLRTMTPPQTYLILIKDGNLALAVGAALEDRLLRDGRCSLSMVPAVRGPDFADTVGDRNLGARFGPWAGTRPPHVVALYEDGLLPRLESLGLAAYIGVPKEEDWRIVRWDNGTGAMLLPVASARDLVDAVADHTPWSLEPKPGPSRRADGVPAAAVGAVGGAIGGSAPGGFTGGFSGGGFGGGSG